MKKTSLTALILVFVLFNAALAYQQKFAWDPNTPTPTGYALFQMDSSTGAYDYSNPIWPTDGTDHTETSATVELPDGFESALVIRAYVDVTGLDGSVVREWSGDSNQVTSKINIQPPKNLVVEILQAMADTIYKLTQLVVALSSATPSETKTP